MTTANRTRLSGILLLTSLLLGACGGGGGGGGGGGSSGGGGGGTTTYTVSVTVAGLTGSSVVLQDNGGDNLTFSANGTKSFATLLASGKAYAVTVLTQPAGQDCTVNGGKGTVGAANITVSVSCAALVNYWTWESGSSLANGAAVYPPTTGVPTAGSTPGARLFASSWTDTAGNLWLFGGEFFASPNTEYLNDLWEYNPSSGLWTWVSGSNGTNAPGNYNALNTPTSTTTPGARYGATTWFDSSTSSLWLFGGFGYDGTIPTPMINDLNDVWKFNTSTKQWTWVSGSEFAGQGGVYSDSTPANNHPGARYAASSAVDSTGKVWLFGGYGEDSTTAIGLLNDLWTYNTSTGIWTHQNGPTTSGGSGNYNNGTPGGTPPSRYLANGWTDASGNFWLFGGLLAVSAVNTTATNSLNDLWKYSGGMWQWVGGSSVPAAHGVYGTKDTAASTNVPGARFSASSWKDTSGKLWLFGGIGYDTTGTNPGYLNDLWNYDTIANKWVWVGGSSTAGASGSYGLLGKPLLSNDPGGRAGAVANIDTNNKVFLFGGFGFDSQGGNGYLNDFWEFAQ